MANNIFSWFLKNKTPQQEAKEVQQKKNDPLTLSVKPAYQSLMKKTLRDWSFAYSSALDPKTPDKFDLQSIYMRMMEDADIVQSLNKRTHNVLEKQFNVYINDTITYEYDDLFKTPEMYEIFKGYLESKFYGYTVMQILGRDEENHISGVDNIDRRYIVPEMGYLKTEQLGGTNISYMKNPWVLQILKDRLGILNGLIPIWIYKQEVIKAWSIHSERFGSPLVIGRTGSNDPNERYEFSQWLKDLTVSSSAVLPLDAQIEFIQQNSSDSYQVYLNLIKFCNEEIAKMIIGGTMLMDDGSSRSQSEVHLEQLNKMIRADITELEWWINKILMKTLKKLEFVKDVNIWIKFDTTEKLQLIDRMDMDKHLIANGYSLDTDYLMDTYNTKILIEENSEDGEDLGQEDLLRKEAQASLKGSVGGVQGILLIQLQVNQGITQYDAALATLIEIYGFEDNVARKVLGNPKKMNKIEDDKIASGTE